MPTVVIMAIGACAGSTAGGIKVIRILICAKSVFNEFVLQLHPRAVVAVKVSGEVVPNDRVRRALILLGPEELDSMIAEDHDFELACRFCGKKYSFRPEDLREIRAQI